jgi:hypothetical protein
MGRKTNHTMSDVTEIDGIIENLERKTYFLIQHRDLLAQFDQDAVYNARGGNWGDLTYVTVNVDYGDGIDIHVSNGPDAKQVMAILRKAIAPGRWEKDTNNYYFSLTREVDGLDIAIKSGREAVCQRVVIGVKTEVIPAREAQPERIEEVEEVEWVCGTLAG